MLVDTISDGFRFSTVSLTRANASNGEVGMSGLTTPIPILYRILRIVVAVPLLPADAKPCR